jgi:hypothetical protein
MERVKAEKKKKQIIARIEELLYNAEVDSEHADTIRPNLTQLQIERDALDEKIGKYKME